MLPSNTVVAGIEPENLFTEKYAYFIVGLLKIDSGNEPVNLLLYIQNPVRAVNPANISGKFPENRLFPI